MKHLKKGFTLIELLVVIGILAVLLAITLIAINPQRQFAQSNNTKRSSDVNAVLNAIGQYAADNSGNLPAGIDATVKTIGKPASATVVDLCTTLVPQYIAALPGDPKTGVSTPVSDCAGTAAYDTRYSITQGASNRITVEALDEELGAVISVTR